MVFFDQMEKDYMRYKIQEDLKARERKIKKIADSNTDLELVKAELKARDKGDHEKANMYRQAFNAKFHEKRRQEEANKKSGCFITTAVCDTFNKPDDCYELTAFRNFRDNWLAKQKDGASLIQKYYATAPAIVEKINSLPNARAIYLAIWAEYLKPCLAYIEQKNFLACKQKYIQMVESLAEKY